MNYENHEPLSELDFTSFKRKIKTVYGLDLEAYKRPQMERRLRANMDKYGATSFQQYFKLIQSDQNLADEFLDRLTINVSELFRNPEQFSILEKKIVPELLSVSKSLAIWSAGCSYGAEPYSLAVMLNEIAQASHHSILATDIDDRMLARARMGIFQDAEIRNVTKQLVDKYFGKTSQGFEACASLKKLIKFEKHNLLESGFKKGFDLILCRNVVIYFTDEAKSVLYKKFFDSLKPGGYLFVGGTERIHDAAQIGFESPIPFFYRKPVKH